jgi:hypothetical protein
LIGWISFAAAAAAGAYVLWPPPGQAPSDVVASKSGASALPEASVPGGGFAALPPREIIGRQRGDAFAARSWAPATPPPAAPRAAGPVAAARPAPPPMPYRVAGQVAQGEGAEVVLAKGDAIFTVREGELLEGGYRVESIGPDSVTLFYVPLGLREKLPLDSTLELVPQAAATPAPAPAAAGAGARPAPPPAAAGPAQLRWEGPARVRKGNTFEVTLKITSDQPLRALPLQLAFDARLLELVAVRPGSFLGKDAKFNYRVSPGGSVFVGASGPGMAASDAEVVIFTFKPIQPAIETELKLSSLLLQGPVGKPIRVDPIVAYRTAIVP